MTTPATIIKTQKPEAAVAAQNPENESQAVPAVAAPALEGEPQTATDVPVTQKKACRRRVPVDGISEINDTLQTTTDLGEAEDEFEDCLDEEADEWEEEEDEEGAEEEEEEADEEEEEEEEDGQEKPASKKSSISQSKKFKCARPVRRKRPWYIKVRSALEKREDSRIAFIMPKQEDPEVIALRRTNKMVQKLIKYMKKSWKVRIDRKQADRELEHRTLVSVYTEKPEDWMERIRAREDRALETGFFSALDEPYNSLINLELDTALLTFKNLPPDLKITAARWIRARLRKEELKRKRDAFLPRLPHGKVKRPSYNKGRLIKDPGGVRKVDEFVKVAEAFLKATRGNTTYSKCLKEWSQKKEKENYSMNSGFGVVREGMFDFSQGKSGQTTGTRESHIEDDSLGQGPDHRRDSIVDGRKYQRDMLQFEKMMGAIYDIMKSLLNIKVKQLESQFPLPPTAVTQIRSRSPNYDDHATGDKEKPMPLLLLQRNLPRKSTIAFGRSSQQTGGPSQRNPNLPPAAQGPEPNMTNIRKSLAEFANKPVRKSDFKARLSTTAPENISAGEIINLSPVRSTTNLVADIKHALSHNDLMSSHHSKRELTATQKIKRLVENPENAAVRRARNYMTYTKLFERHNKKVRRPVWHHIDIAAATQFGSTGLAGKDPAHLTEADAAEVVQMALAKRRNLSRVVENEGEPKRWPEEHDIPTPTYPFPRSKVRIPSEEQSRLDLLKKTPHIDTVPSTPVRRLYKLAGVRTTEKDIFTNIMDMKKMFRVTENKIRVYYENEIGKLDWDTTKRFRYKLNGIKSTPVYQWTIGMMRLNQAGPVVVRSPSQMQTEDDEKEKKKLRQKRPALWYKKLQEEGEMTGASRHNGCIAMYQKLLKYCDVDMKTKPHMINRLALLIVSLPTTELGTKHWQQAVVFLLEFMFGTPPEVIHQWLKYRGLPYLL